MLLSWYRIQSRTSLNKENIHKLFSLFHNQFITLKKLRASETSQVYSFVHEWQLWTVWSCTCAANPSIRDTKHDGKFGRALAIRRVNEILDTEGSHLTNATARLIAMLARRFWVDTRTYDCTCLRPWAAH